MYEGTWEVTSSERTKSIPWDQSENRAVPVCKKNHFRMIIADMDLISFGCDTEHNLGQLPIFFIEERDTYCTASLERKIVG